MSASRILHSKPDNQLVTLEEGVVFGMRWRSDGWWQESDSLESFNCMWPVYNQGVFAYYIFKRRVENQMLPSNTEERKVVVAEIQGQH